VIGKEVMFVPEIAGDVVKQAVGILRPGDVAILENTRFWKGEEKNDPDFARAIAANGDFYVNDAFSAAHRAHATTEGLARLLPAYAGRSMQAELRRSTRRWAIRKSRSPRWSAGPRFPVQARRAHPPGRQVDHLIIGGGMANTFLAAKGVDVGKSLCEHDLTGPRTRSSPPPMQVGLHCPPAL
jgi:phosphoglycerate kinase